MSAAELLGQLEALGAKLIANGDRLKINAPAGAITEELRAAVAANKAALLAFLNTTARPVNVGVDVRSDPRPDLAEDSALWTEVLTAAAALDYSDPQGVYGALYAVRACGATLRVYSWQLVRPNDLDMAEWTAALEPHRATLAKLLTVKGLRNRENTGAQADAK